MTRGDGGVPWGLSTDRVLYLCLDNLRGYLDHTGITFNRPMRVLSCYLFLIFVSTSICLVTFLRARREYGIHTRETLRALLTVMAPTCSLWPNRYVYLANNIHSYVDIPFEMIIEDTTSGAIELRDPINDLTDLIGPGVTVRGHTIRTNIGWRWWISCFEWWMLAKFKLDYPSPQSPGCMSRLPDISKSANPNPFGPTSSASCPLLCIDHLPPDVIPSLSAGCKVTLEFTAFSPYLRPFSTAQIFSAVPFIASKHLPRRPRSLVSVLKQLGTSCDPSLVVDSVSNISADYEHTLRHVYGLFSGGHTTREAWVKSMGIRACRQDMLLVALEAALLRRGWIERWAIQVTAK